jgi:hypothetical protein
MSVWLIFQSIFNGAVRRDRYMCKYIGYRERQDHRVVKEIHEQGWCICIIN